MPCCYRILTAPKTPVPLPAAPADDLPARLRRHRESLRLSRRAMAIQMGVEEATYLCWERGEHAPDLRALPSVLAALGQPPAALESAGLAVRLRAWRRAYGVSQAEAAALVGVDAKTLGSLERGRRMARGTVEAIEALFKRSPSASSSPLSQFPVTATPSEARHGH